MRMRSIACFGLFIWSVGRMPLASEVPQPPRMFTLEESLRMALEQSGTARNARRDQTIAETKVTQARSEAFPHLSVSADYTRLDETQTIDIGGETSDMGALDNYSVTASINQLLYSGGRVGAALRTARLVRIHAEWTRQEAEAMIRRNVRLGFWDILMARAAVAVSEESVGQMELLVKQTQEKAARGAASEFDVLTAQVKLANEKPALIRARGNLSLATESFRRLLGLDDAPFDVTGDLTHEKVRVSRARLEQKAMQRRPAVHIAETLVKLLREDVVVAKSKGWPSVSAFASYNGANAYRFVSFSDQWEWHWSAGLTANWDIWDGGLTRGSAREKQLIVDKAATDRDELLKAIRLEVRQGFIDLEHSSEEMDAARGTVGLAEKALGIARTRHGQGLSTYLEFADASLGLSTARLALIRAQADHLKALARLMQATGLDESEIPDDEGK